MILVTGGAGYIGSVLVRELLKRGEKVRIFDKLYFGKESLEEIETEIEIIEGDIRNFDERILEGIEAVIHLAAISNDPTAEYDPVANMEINAVGTEKIAKVAKKKGIKRFIYTSSCSIYYSLNADDKIKTEEAEVIPTAAYSLSKLKGERAVLSLADENFSPVILRLGTVYGASYRMRYDLVVNTMLKDAVSCGRIFVFAGGEMWRPLVNIKDVAECCYLCLKVKEEKIRGEVFNLLFDNYRIIDLAKEIIDTLKDKLDVKLEIKPVNTPVRSYKVSSDKIRKILNFQPKISVKDSVKNMFEIIKLDKYADFNNPLYYNIETMLTFQKENLKKI